jgi:DNA-binding response OmpR family regulator
MPLVDPKVVLIIDDDSYIRRVIELKLTRHGYRVVTAENGAEAVNLIHSLKPDVMITDLNMPGVDGEAVCRMANPLKKERSFLTIVLSARIRREDRTWLAEMDDTQFMEKPFSPSRLLAAVNQHCISER